MAARPGFARSGTAFDLMIVDIFMPHMRGFESIRIFHERAPTIPLVAMSGYAFANLNSPAPDFLRMALELGASRCLRKPFTPAALQIAIDECLSEARSWVSGVAQLKVTAASRLGRSLTHPYSSVQQN